MAESQQVNGGLEQDPEIDWEAAERSPEFRALIAKRRSFVLPATIFFLAWYFGFIILCGYAPDFMGESIYQGLTVGYVLALTQFIMVWVLCAAYLRKADRDFDPLASKAVARALEAGRERAGDGAAPSGGGSERGETPPGGEEVTPR